MKASDRIARIAGDGDGWDVYYRARAMVAAGERIVNLTIGEHDIPTDPEIADAVHASMQAGNTGYAEVPGQRDLRGAVADRVAARTGVPTGPGNVLITPGGQAALFAAHMAACDPGDRAVFVDPYYATYPGTIRAAGLEPVPVVTRSSDGFVPGEDALRAAARGARSVLVNTPNNPTGQVYGTGTLEAIARVASEGDLWVISDEVYETQVWRGAHLSPRALPGMAGRTLVVGSMSKGHAMTGSRIGWIVGPEDAIGALVDLATVTTYGVPGFLQDAARHALSLGPVFEARIAAPFRRRAALAAEALGDAGPLRLLPADAAMYVMADIRATGLSGEAFARRLLEARNIAVMPGESFGSSAAGHIRIALTVEDAALARALREIARFAKEIP